MSRRFGRNQKRKMREQIANAMQTLEEARASRKRMKEMFDDMAQELDDAKRIAGPMSILFEPTTTALQGAVRDYVEVGAQAQPLSLDFMEAARTFRSMRLPLLLSKVDQDRLQEMVHVRVRYEDKTVGYGITQEVMQCVPRDILLRRVGVEVAHQLIQEIMKGSK